MLSAREAWEEARDALSQAVASRPSTVATTARPAAVMSRPSTSSIGTRPLHWSMPASPQHLPLLNHALGLSPDPNSPLPRHTMNSPLERGRKLKEVSGVTATAMTASTFASASASSSLPDSPRHIVTLASLRKVVPVKDRSDSHMASWLEDERVRDRRMAKLLQVMSWELDESIMGRAERLNRMRQLAALKQEELTELRGELAEVTERTALQGKDAKALDARASELSAKLEEMNEASEAAMHDNAVCAHVAERLSKRRPHLVRKLAFLRSSIIEIHERHAVAEEAMGVAALAREHAQEMVGERRESNKDAVKAYEERRQHMLAELQDSSPDSRRPNLDLGGRMNAKRLKFLQEQAAEEEVRAQAELAAEAAAMQARGDDRYWEVSQGSDRTAMGASAAAAIADAAAGTSSHYREAWEQLSLVASSDNVRMGMCMCMCMGAALARRLE